MSVQVSTDNGTVEMVGNKIVEKVRVLEAKDGSLWVPSGNKDGGYRAFEPGSDKPKNSAPDFDALQWENASGGDDEEMSADEVAALLGYDPNPSGEGNERASGADAGGSGSDDDGDDGVVPKGGKR